MGILFLNDSDKRRSKVKSFKKCFWGKSYRLAGKVYDKILPIIEQLSEDIKTITPDEITKAYLKPQKDVNRFAEYAETASTSAHFISQDNSYNSASQDVTKYEW